MKSIISFILVIIMMFASIINGFSPVAGDLSVAENNPYTGEISEADKLLLEYIYTTETAWLASLQLSNGAIPMTAAKDGEVTVNPYFSDIAALAMLDNAEKYKDNVKSYLDWHFSHLNTAETDYNKTDATIYDYTVTLENGNIVKEEISVKDDKPSYDSTDSYAATFLTLLGKYYDKTADIEYIKANYSDIVRITEAMLYTLNLGLTYAKPDYKIMYLMDNCEVYEGALSASRLLALVSDRSPEQNLILTKVTYAADWIKSTVEKKLWNSEDGYYEAGLFTDGKPAYEFSWDNFYPCATAQLFPVIHGLIPADSSRAVTLYDSFCDSYSWETFDIPSDFYWGSNVLAAAEIGDSERVMSYMRNYTSLMLLHKYPLYNADAARVSMAAYKLLNAE